MRQHNCKRCSESSRDGERRRSFAALECARCAIGRIFSRAFSRSSNINVDFRRIPSSESQKRVASAREIRNRRSSLPPFLRGSLSFDFHRYSRVQILQHHQRAFQTFDALSFVADSSPKWATPRASSRSTFTCKPCFVRWPSLKCL